MSDKNYDWPQTSPIDKSDPYWEINNNLNVNGTPYKKEEVSPGRWEWVVDREQQALIDSIYDRADFLYTALRTRILTDEEYWEAVNLGRTLIVRPMAPYNQNEVQSMVDTAFLQQARLRAAYGMPLPKPKTLEITGNVRHDMETAAPPPASNEERE